METPTPVLSTCLICFEERALKIVGNCKHSFCTKCLTTVLGSLESGSEVFACPSCKVDCPLPWDGVNGMVDFTGDTVDAADIDPVVIPEENETESRGLDTANVTCDICGDEEKVERAVNICPECDSVHLCQNCSRKHNKNKATRNHLLTPIVMKIAEKEPTCEAHHKVLICFCQTCGVQACGICVTVKHGDHDVERLSDTIRSKVEDIRNALKLREDKLKDLQQLENELTLLEARAPIVDKQDILIKEIEDHTQKCMDQIVAWKEDLKKQVKKDYKIIQDIPIGLEKVSKEVQKLQEPINKATQLLSKTEQHSLYLDQLISLQQDLEAIADIDENVEEREYRNILRKVHSEDTTFHAEPMSRRSGRLDRKSGQMPKTEPGRLFKVKEIFQHTVEGVSSANDTFIPCVASLGSKCYAVAHPTKMGELSNAIDIFDYQGTLKVTLKDHVPPLYDMTSTPDGKLAVLSDGAAKPNCSVKVFDLETGYIDSTCDIGTAKPISLGVTLKQQYVILGANEEGQTEIILASKTGNVEHRYTIHETDNIQNPTTITCGGRFIFVTGENIVIYEIRNTGLQRTKTCTNLNVRTITDTTATIWDDFFLTDFDDKHGVFLNRVCDEENKLQPPQLKYTCLHEAKTLADRETRVSTTDGHTVVISHGHTIRVFKCQ